MQTLARMVLSICTASDRPPGYTIASFHRILCLIIPTSFRRWPSLSQTALSSHLLQLFVNLEIRLSFTINLESFNHVEVGHGAVCLAQFGLHGLTGEVLVVEV